MNENFEITAGVIIKGHQIASGIAKDSPYKSGTILLQKPFFKSLGLDLEDYFMGTLNVSIEPKTFRVTNPKFTFRNVRWYQDRISETFSFSRCQLNYDNTWHDSLIYYPHPETKVGHFQSNSTLEIISKKILNITYGSKIELRTNTQEIEIL